MIAAEHLPPATSRKPRGGSEPHPGGRAGDRCLPGASRALWRRSSSSSSSDPLLRTVESKYNLCKAPCLEELKKGEEKAGKGVGVLSFWRQFFFFQNASVWRRSGAGEERGGVGCSSNIAPLRQTPTSSWERRAGTGLLGNSLVIYEWGKGKKLKQKNFNNNNNKKARTGLW